MCAQSSKYAMRAFRFASILMLVSFSTEAWSQENRKRDEDFVKAKPTIGDTLPRLTVFTPEGKPVETASLQGQYAVIVFGCLT
jgi:cytochrome oxidase Cu insertion factor (SCO1/SenC/PrrC family)